MPIRAASKIVKILSNQFYEYGKSAASRTYLLLLLSISFISFFSFPPVSQYLSDVVAPTLHSNIPSAHISTSLDAQCWHASAHIQFNNFTLSRNSPANYLLTEQIRISRPNESVNYELIQLAKQIYESIATTMVTVSSSAAPVSLATICYKHQDHCLIHAPPFMAFQNELDWTLNTKLGNNDNSYETHPYSVYSNATFDRQGNFVKADAVLLTFVLNQTLQSGDTLAIWNKILDEVKSKFDVLDIQQHSDRHGSLWSSLSNTVPHMIQYKFNLFPYDISYNVQFSITAYIIIFFLVSMAFGKSNLVKSGYTFGLAAVFLSIACFTTTWGVFDKLGISFHSAPWYLLLLVVNIGCLENIFLLTNAVLYAGCDMIVTEKISRGLQSVGVPMTATLIAELLILSVGAHMDTDLVREFCTFAKVALIVDYILEMTFVIAVLSIDIKRVELADLDDRQMSKRLHELASFDHDKERIESDFCPIQDTPNKEDSKSCAECKEFKTHRVFCAFMLCLILLSLSLFVSKDHHHHQQRYKNVPNALISTEMHHQPDLYQLSDQFWSTVNPQRDVTWLQIQPPHLFIVDSDINRVQVHLDFLQQLYKVKAKAIHYRAEHRPSRFRRFVLSLLQSFLVTVLSINIPILILCLVMIGIITWMTPKWRKQWLVPLLIHCFNEFFLYLIRCYPTQYLKRMYFIWVKGRSFEGGIKEYDADGIHHRGAITVQHIFNQQQYRANVKTVQLRTLTNQHIADIQNLDANAKQSLVSCGQDGRIILWNVDRKMATWVARFDKLYPSRGGVLQALLNPIFFPSSNKKKTLSKKTYRQQQQQQQQQESPQTQLQKQRSISLSKNCLSKARLVKIDQGNKWAAAGYDDGLIRVWNVSNGALVREMDVYPQMPCVEVQEEPSSAGSSSSSTMRNRFSNGHSGSSSPTLTHNSFGFSFSSSSSASSATFHSAASARKTAIDRILSIAFIGVITEFCHPLVAEAAARCRSSADVEASQNYLVSAHKSGVLHEWNILSGECIQSIKTGHTKDITQLHVVDSKAPHRKLGVTWVFTASKDGTVKCWERRLITTKYATDDNDHHHHGDDLTKWTPVYTIKLNSPVTSIATELPVGGMGVLVTGCSDGTVKVWNFDTGEAVCTLSLGKASQNISSITCDYGVDSAGGPIRKFSKFSTHVAGQSTSDGSDGDSSDSSLSAYSRRTAADHRGAIYQVVVTRYCEVENGPGLCRGCDTCFGNGFLIASSAMDNKVHAWRLERSDNGHEGSCRLCTKDYHRKQYKHRKSSLSNSDDGNSDALLHKSATGSSRRRRASQQRNHSPTVKKRHVATRTANGNNNNNTKDDLLELLDIEQLAGDAYIPLRPTFLGKIDQPAGRGVVFCDKILAGVRRRHSSSIHSSSSSKASKNGNSEWEAWFASLQYYDPAESKEDGAISSIKIPIETFNLDNDEQDISLGPLADKDEDSRKAAHVLRGTLLSLFSSSTSPSAGSNNGAYAKDQLRYKGIHAHVSENEEDTKKFDDGDLHDDESLEASENLPFSEVRHVIPLDGAGLACDFGNFIKLVYLDKPTLTEKEHAKQTRDDMEDHKRRQTIAEQVVVEEDESEESLHCQCGSDDGGATSCLPANKGKDGCCGGVNKEKNGGKCCGGAGNVKKRQQEKRQQKLLLKKQTLSFDNSNSSTCGGIRSIAECSLKNNCSRAADCASSNQALASSASVSSFSNWL
ncbi:hypothetical protein [Parasitella parasitica]|uniref:Sterol regulatory element-binding protein cleavage-activating protein n=1 Tax=Parasitella parasitica TaxID=35722 RepID=A0A0B7N8V6_9FUNG|nr:hypothetical protein [Parasitella parasitica]